MEPDDKFFFSEFDSAKQPLHWSSLAQSFYCTARIIDEEYDKTKSMWDKSENRIYTVEITERIACGTEIPATFCMAIALELVVKAAYIQEIGKQEMKPNENLNFTTHKITELVQKITRVKLCEDEMDELTIAEEIILQGKYPAPKKPSDTKRYRVNPSLKRTIEKLEPIYLKFQKCVSDHQKE